MRKWIIFIICILAAISCFGYCLFVFRIRSGNNFFLVWAMGGAVFIVLACIEYFGWWALLPQAIRKMILCIITVALLVFAVVECFIFSWYHSRGEPELEYIIVLGAQMKPNGPSAVLKFRLDEAYDYLLANPDTICIVSGGQGSNEHCSEAEGMYEYLTAKGIAPGRIIKEDRSSNTKENMAFSAELMPDKNVRVGIVTNNFHVFRSVHIAKKEGIHNVCGIAARSNIYFLPNNLLREFFGVMKDLVYGNLI